MGVLATVRGRPVDVPLELDRAFATFRRLAIEPLSVGAIHRVLWGRLSLNLPRPVLVRVHEITGGNPFFALELGRALAEGAIRADGADVTLPESLSALLTDRLRALARGCPQDARRRRRARVPLGDAARAAGATPSTTSNSPRSMAWSSSMATGSASRIRSSPPPATRRCRCTEGAGSTAVSRELDVDLEERARHLAIAATGPDEEIAAALDAAAAHARARGAAQAAADLSERAVALTPAEALESINRRRITAAERSRYAGDMKKAAVLLEEAVASSPPGRVRADALSQLAGVRGMTEGFPVTVNLLSHALAEPDLEPGQEVNILCELAWMAHQGGDNEGALAMPTQGWRSPSSSQTRPPSRSPSRRSRKSASRAPGGSGVTSSTVRWSSSRPSTATATRPHAGGHGMPVCRCACRPSRVTLALLLGRSDRHDESRTLWRALTAEARERADPDVVRCLFHRAQMEMTAGAWDAAAQLCDEAIQLTRQIGLEVFEPLCLSILAEIDAYRGETEEGARQRSPNCSGWSRRAGSDGPPSACGSHSRSSSSPTTMAPRAGGRPRRFSTTSRSSTGTSPSWRARPGSRP